MKQHRGEFRCVHVRAGSSVMLCRLKKEGQREVMLRVPGVGVKDRKEQVTHE